MAANEDYLDSLLKAAMDSEKKDDPNRPLTPEEIEAMFASAQADTESDVEASTETDSESDVEANAEADSESVMEENIISDAASGTEANTLADTESDVETNATSDVESGEEISADDGENVDIFEMAEPHDNSAILDHDHTEVQDIPDPEDTNSVDEDAIPVAELLSGLDSIEDLDAATNHAQPQSESAGPEADSHNEMEFDLNSIDDIDELLGLKEMPDDYKEDLKNTEADPGTEATDMQDKGTSDELDLEGQDLSELLDLLGEDNDDLAEINDILKKSDNHEIVDSGSIQELENMMSADAENSASKDGEDTEKEEKKEREKKRKLFGRKKKKEAADETAENETEEDGEPVSESIDAFATDFEALSGGAGSEGADSEAESEEKKEKNGFFKKILQILTEEIDDEPETEEEADAPQKKEKKAKKGKKKKGAETNEELLEEMAEEDAKAIKEKKKEKKPKKEKKKKEKIKIEDAGAQNEKKLPKKMVVRIFVLGFSILAVVVIVAIFTPKLISLQKAHSLFYKGDYKNAYKELIAQGSLGESDKVLLEKAELLTELDNKNSLYQAYSAADMSLDGVNTLLEGIDCYQKNIDRYAQYGISYEAELFYEKFMTELSTTYGLTAEQVNEILQMDSVAYTYKLREITNTTGQSQAPVSGENPATVSVNDIQSGESYEQDANGTSMADPLADELE